MTMAYRFAHLTDPHLPLTRGDLRPVARLMNKRLSGALSWGFRRRHLHLPEVLARTAADIHAHRPGHIVLTGDLVNISLPQEFARATQWLATLGDPENVSVTPGNHDAYVKSAVETGIWPWAAYMQGDAGNGKTEFPYCRIREGIAFIGLSTAVPTPLFSAAGGIGAEQLTKLGRLLESLGRDGMMRVVMLHHPPGAAGDSRRHGLQDREALRRVIARHGAELILHGHTHRSVLDYLSGPRGPAPVLAPSSASALDPNGENARWHLLEAERAAGGGWRIGVTVRGLDGLGQFRTEGKFYLRSETVNTAW
ncbi:MAG TPA: metallophosphatase [Alphaproteobacteria bacterium]|nr:metallophosphatase [Alphaproteobacteria bacterium]